MKYNVKIYFREINLTTIYNVEAVSPEEAIDIVQENLEIDFEVEENE
jgi:hypothetical protein